MNSPLQKAVYQNDWYTSDDLMAFDQRYRVNFVNSLSGYKSANLVGTQNADGNTNLAIFSSVVHLGADPALMGMIIRPDNGDRHTLQNIIDTGEYSINHVGQDFYQQAHQTSARYGKGISEFDATGLTAAYIDGFDAPFVAESPLKIGLILKEIVPIHANDTVMIVGEVVSVCLDKQLVCSDGYIDIHELGSVAVSGLDSYHEGQLISRLSYAKAETPLKTI